MTKAEWRRSSEAQPVLHAFRMIETLATGVGMGGDPGIVNAELDAARDAIVACIDRIRACNAAEAAAAIDHVAWFESSIYVLSIRAQTRLARLKVETLDELTRYSAADLVKLKGFGRVSLAEVERVLRDRGLTLRVPADRGGVE